MTSQKTAAKETTSSSMLKVPTISDCTIIRNRCEISNDVMVLIWNILWDMSGHEP